MKIPYAYLLVGPTLLYALGFFLNVIVLSVNNGQMPVLVPGGCDPQLFGQDMLHKCMTNASHLKVLADWIVIKEGFGVKVASPGDFLMWAYDFIFAPALILWAYVMICYYNSRFD